MSLPYLHIFHPVEQRLPGITEWLAEMEGTLSGIPVWDACKFRRVLYDSEGWFDVPTQYDHIMRALGPVILIQNVQSSIRDRLEKMIARRTCVYCIPVICAEDIWEAVERAREAYDDGQPRIPIRELVAYLIVRKLHRLDKWGGTAKNKDFLWGYDLPKGGFPKEYSEKRQIFEVARELERYEVVKRKSSQGVAKYALDNKLLVHPIIDNKSFAHIPQLRKFFEQGRGLATARLLDFNDESLIPAAIGDGKERA